MGKSLCVMGCTMRPHVKNKERDGGKEVGQEGETIVLCEIT